MQKLVSVLLVFSAILVVSVTVNLLMWEHPSVHHAESGVQTRGAIGGAFSAFAFLLAAALIGQENEGKDGK